MIDFDTAVQTITVVLIPVLFAISLHEAAHGYVARYFGDPTAANEGRLSLNPIRHIDPFGTVLLPLVLFLMQLPPLGYARPVPVDTDRLRNPKKQMAFVAAAGPAANFAMGLGWLVLQKMLAAVGADHFFIQMATAGIMVNSAMCVFNLIPLPPLDGGRIVTGLLPMPYARHFAQIERYGLLIFLGLIVSIHLGWLNGPLVAGMVFIQQIYDVLVSPLNFLFN